MLGHILTLLFILNCFTTWCLCFVFVNKSFRHFRISFIVSNCLFAVLTLLFLVLLSIPVQLTRVNLSLLWFITNVLLFVLIYRQLKKSNDRVLPGLVDIYKSFHCISLPEKFIFLFLLIIFVTSLINALVSPIAYVDSHEYHMAVVVNWIQNQSIANYATHICRQFATTSFSHYAITNLFLLTGSDLLANTVQWFYFLSSAIAISVIAEKLGLSGRFQLISALLYATLPLAILQSYTTQNDIVATFWCLSFVMFALDAISKDKLVISGENIFTVALLSASLSFAFLTKGTAVIAIFPFFIWLIVARIIKKDRVFDLFKCVCIAIAIFIILNMFGFYQNYKISGNFLSAYSESVLPAIHIESIEPRAIFLNSIKNTWMQLDFDISNNNGTQLAEKVVHGLAGFLGITENDSYFSWTGREFALRPLQIHSAYSGNRWHVLLSFVSFLFVFVIFLCRKYKFKVEKKQFLFIVISLCSFILLASITKWQPWVTRLLSPATALLVFSPVFAVRLISNSIVKRIIAGFLVILLSATSLPYVFLLQGQYIIYTYQTRSTLVADGADKAEIVRRYLSSNATGAHFYSRDFWIFKDARDKLIPYITMLDFIKDNNFSQIGLVLKLASWEYPFHYYLIDHETTIRHVMVENRSSIYESLDFIPEVILFVDVEYPEESFYYNGHKYIHVLSIGELHSVFVRDD